MKKRVLFIIPSFGVGGTTVSVKNLLLLLDKQKYDVTILAMSDKGPLEYLYEDIKQIRPSFTLKSLSVVSWREQKGLFRKLLCGFIRYVARVGKIKNMLFTLAARMIPLLNTYDVIVACQEGLCTYFTSTIKAKRKVAWVRCDYERYVKELGCREDDIYASFERIVCVSDIIFKKFISIYPLLTDKTLSINNPQSVQFIIDQAEKQEDDENFSTDLFTIVSVGRFDPIKRFEQIPQIAHNLESMGINFRWYIIGGGSEAIRCSILKNIEQYHLEEKVVLLGIKQNPHYYIKQSDLLVVLSSSEACPRVVNEAKILHVPVVCADFDTAKEYITSGKDGIISTIEGMTDAIVSMIKNKKAYQDIKNTIKQFQFNNEALIDKINGIL